MVQTFIQLANENDESGEFFNYVGSMRISDQENSGERTFPEYYDNNSCGLDKLTSIDGLTFQGVEAAATGCGFYDQDRTEIRWTNSAEDGVGWEVAIARKLLEFGLVRVEAGDTLQLLVGFNIFDSYEDLHRS